jgi:hypothetical protein
MPEAQIKKQGGAKRWVRKKLPGGKYINIAITKKAGPEGGHSVAGPVHQSLDWDTPKHKADAILRKKGHK